MDPDRVRRTRASANLLHRPVTTAGPAGVTDVVRRTGGLQAQTWTGAVLQVRSRSTATTKADVDAAREQDRSVVRGWFLRGTLHLVATEDFDWLLGLLGPVLEKQNERRYRQLGLDQDVRARATSLVVGELQHGPRTRTELREALLGAGVIDGSDPQQVIHLLFHIAIAGLICNGPDAGRDPAWVLAADWLDRPGTTVDPLPELAGRYLAAYGPATPKDLSTWSGLPVTTARQAFAARDDLVDVDGLAMLKASRAEVATGPVRMLGEFDTYLLGHADRTPILDPERKREVNAGGGLINPVITEDGRVTGTWRFDKTKGVVSVDPFTSMADLSQEIEDIQRFYALAAI